MLKTFLRRPFYNYASDLEKAFILKFKVKDVTKIRGLSTNTPYIIIEGERINIPRTTLVANVIT
jgi:hypothetical protein